MSLERINIMLDREELKKAQSLAARAGLDPAIAGNTSGFIRYLITRAISQERK